MFHLAFLHHLNRKLNGMTRSIKKYSTQFHQIQMANSLQVGDFFYCVDIHASFNIIRAVKVIEQKVDTIKIHYVNWIDKYDEWIKRTSDRIRLDLCKWNETFYKNPQKQVRLFKRGAFTTIERKNLDDSDVQYASPVPGEQSVVPPSKQEECKTNTIICVKNSKNTVMYIKVSNIFRSVVLLDSITKFSVDDDQKHVLIEYSNQSKVKVGPLDISNVCHVMDALCEHVYDISSSLYSPSAPPPEFYSK